MPQVDLDRAQKGLFLLAQLKVLLITNVSQVKDIFFTKRLSYFGKLTSYFRIIFSL